MLRVSDLAQLSEAARRTVREGLRGRDEGSTSAINEVNSTSDSPSMSTLM